MSNLAYESVFESVVASALEDQAAATKALVEEQRTANDLARTANLIAAGRLAVEARVAGADHLGGWGEDVLSEIHTRLASTDTREQMGLN